jgi:hypothetical protein
MSGKQPLAAKLAVYARGDLDILLTNRQSNDSNIITLGPSRK